MWTHAVLERGVVERRDVPEPHHADVGDDAEPRGGERPGRALDAVDAARGRAQDLRGQAEREQDRRDVGDQQVLDHVHRGELLAEPVDRRDQRDEQRQDAAAPGREPPAARRSRAALAPRRAPARDVHAEVAGEREEHDRREGPRSVD